MAFAAAACSLTAPSPITVPNGAAQVQASSPAGVAPFDVQFTAALPRGVDTEDASFRWDFGDGSTGQGHAPSHTYTKAGNYQVKVDIFSGAAGGSSDGTPVGSSTVHVAVRPGPMASAMITAGAPSVLTGDALELSLVAHDRFGNQVSPSGVTWEASSGSVSSSPDGAVFTAGRESGEVRVTAAVRAGDAVVTSETSVHVAPGYCETEPQHAAWEAVWLPPQDDSPLARTVLPGSFVLTEAPESVEGAARVQASTQVLVRRQGPVRFAVEANGAARLLVNGSPVLSAMGGGETLVHMDPGVHRLALEYVWPNGPEATPDLKFAADGDVLAWDAVTECHGGYAARPDERYVLLEAEDDLADAANRFGVAEQALLPVTGPHGRALLVPGMPGPETKVIVIHGLGTKSTCAADDRSYVRGQSIAHAVQTDVWEDTGRVGDLDWDDFITFSYSGDYVDCGQSNAAAQDAPASGLRAAYASADTCVGVEDASARLEALVESIHAETPDARVVLIGHSLGGMVGAHYLATQGDTPASSIVEALVTLDSPLRGYRGPEVGLDCAYESPSRRDIRAVTSTVTTIMGLSASPWADRLHAINSTFVGNAIGVDLVDVRCATEVPPSEDVLTVLFGFAVQAFRGFAQGHNCAFTHPDALAAMAGIVNGP
ncbi:MAG: PKD domain-containing protein [Dehalococcoidia bacterium]